MAEKKRGVPGDHLPDADARFKIDLDQSLDLGGDEEESELPTGGDSSYQIKVDPSLFEGGDEDDGGDPNVKTFSIDDKGTPTQEDLSKLDLARDFAVQLTKGMKNIGIYRHATARYAEFVKKAFESLSIFLEKHGPLPLKVESQAFTYESETVLDAEGSAENLPYKFWRDGIRHVILRPGLTADEFLRFVFVAMSDPARDEDVLSQLWKAAFEHIEYVVVEGFAVGEATEEEVAVEVDQVLGYLYDRLKSDSGDTLAFARLSAEDLEMRLEGVEQIRGAAIQKAVAEPAYCQRLQREIREDEDVLLFPKVVETMFRVVQEVGFEDLDVLREVAVQLLDAMLVREDFEAILAIHARFRELGEDSSSAELAAKLSLFFRARMGDEQRLRHVGELLKAGRPRNASDLYRYLIALDERAVVPLLEVLDGVEIPENRKLICDALIFLGRDHPEPFVRRLQSERSLLVRDMMEIIERCDFPDKLRYYREALKAPAMAARLEAISVLSRFEGEQYRPFLVAALADPTPQVRMQAARVLPRHKPEVAVQDLLTVVRSPAFERRQANERQEFYVALGATQRPEALAFFTQQLAQKGTLLRGLKEQKLMCVAGLAAMPGVPASKVLGNVLADGTDDPEVVSAARQALYAMKRSVLGAPKKPPLSEAP